ncbi:hypothetical protein ACWC98_17505 [Streptomyces goshikiensis]
MSSEQHDADEPKATADYVRADPSKFPTTEAGQRAAAEGMAAAKGYTAMSSAEILRSVRATEQKRLTPKPQEANRLREMMFELIEAHEADQLRHRAQQEAAHGLTRLAEQYAAAKSFEDRDEVVEQFVSRLSLSDAGLFRRVAKAMERVLPNVIVGAHIGDSERPDGMSAQEIARELGCTTRHAYQVISDNPWEARWVLERATGDGGWDYWRGSTETTTATAEELAERILEREVADDDALTLSDNRVCVWWTADDLDDPLDADQARAIAEYQMDDPGPND